MTSDETEIFETCIGGTYVCNDDYCLANFARNECLDGIIPEPEGESILYFAQKPSEGDVIHERSERGMTGSVMEDHWAETAKAKRNQG